MSTKFTLRFIVAVLVVFQVFAQTWNHGPSDVQQIEGGDVTLECQLDGEVIPGLEPQWERIPSGDTSSTLIAAVSTGCVLDNCEFDIDNTTNSYNLVLTGVKLTDEGEYRCSVLNIQPQFESANLGVWVLPSEVSIGDEETVITQEMPEAGESITVSRTCEVDGVVPAAELTWTYKISSDGSIEGSDDRSIEGELDYEFESGTIDDDIPPSVNYNVEVEKETVESDGKYKSTSTITVTFTADSDGKVEDNLQIEVKCKSKQVALVKPDDERLSDPIKVSVVEREEVMTSAETKTKKPGYAGPTDKPGSTTKGKDPTSGASTGGGCTSGCVTGIVVALLLVLIIGVIVVVIFVLRNRKAKNAKKDDTKDKKDPAPVHV